MEDLTSRVIAPAPLCGYWVASSWNDPDAHVCAKDAAYVAEKDDDELALCQVHATETRLAALKARGYSVRYLDDD